MFRFALIFWLFPFYVTGQSRSEKLTLNEMINFLYRDVKQVNQVLKSKGWIYNEEGPHEKGTKTTVWTFPGLDKQKTNVTYSSDVRQGKNSPTVVYSCQSLPFFNAIKSELHSLKMKRTDSGVNEYGNMYSVYVSAKYHITLETVDAQNGGGYKIALTGRNLTGN